MKEAGRARTAREEGEAGWAKLALGARWAAVSTTSSAGGMPSSGLAPFCAMLDGSGRARLALPMSALGSQGERLFDDGRVCLLIVDASGSDPMPLRAVVEGRAKMASRGEEPAELARRLSRAKFGAEGSGPEESWAIVEPWGATVWIGASRVAALDAEELARGLLAAATAPLEVRKAAREDEPGAQPPRQQAAAAAPRLG